MRRTIALWLILVVVFVAVYNLNSTPAPRDESEAASAGTHAKGPVWPPWTSWAVLGGLLVAVGLYANYAQRNTGPSHEGVRLLNQGRYSQALEIFEGMRQANKQEPTIIYNCAVTRLHLWQLEAALRDFELVQGLRGEKPVIAALLPEHLALTYALLGKLPEARQALASVPKDKGELGRMGLVSALVLLRGGDVSGARAKLASFEVKQLGGAMGTLARTAEAFCIEQLSGEKRHVDRVALFGETGPEGLRNAWPELIAFVERAPAW